MSEYRILAYQQENKSILFEVRDVERGSYEVNLCELNKKDLCKKLKEIKKASEKPVLWGNTSKIGQVYKKLKQKV